MIGQTQVFGQAHIELLTEKKKSNEFDKSWEMLYRHFDQLNVIISLACPKGILEKKAINKTANFLPPPLIFT